MTKVTGDSALGLCFTVHIWNGSLDQTANIMTRSLPHSRVICHKHEYVQWLTMYFKLKSPSSFKGTTAWILRQSLVVSFQSSLLSNYWLRCQIIAYTSSPYCCCLISWVNYNVEVDVFPLLTGWWNSTTYITKCHPFVLTATLKLNRQTTIRIVRRSTVVQ